MGNGSGKGHSNTSRNTPHTKQTVMSYSRRAHHAGSWYSDDARVLEGTLQEYIRQAASQQPTTSTTATSPPTQLRGVMCPHAGYSYSGPTAAYSYLAVQQALQSQDNPIRHILVIHPSHHVYLDGCAVSGANALETPLGPLPVDDSLRREIQGLSAEISTMSQSVDEAEHSGEMQYPYLKLAMGSRNNLIPVLPLMIGSISTEQEARLGQLLAPIVARPDVLCVISTDFCHWGSRFQYQPTPSSSSALAIYQHIQQLDQQGMDHISMQDPGAFAKYIKLTRNTVCGRHPIGVWLQAVHWNSKNQTDLVDIDFVHYEQSSEVTSMRDSSVSYVSATARTKR